MRIAGRLLTCLLCDCTLTYAYGICCFFQEYGFGSIWLEMVVVAGIDQIEHMMMTCIEHMASCVM